MTSVPGRRTTLVKHGGGQPTGRRCLLAARSVSSEPFSQYRRFGSKNTTGSSQAMAARSMS